MKAAVCRAFGEPERADDPAYATLLDRMQRVAELTRWQAGHIARYQTEELCALLDEHEVPCARVNTLDDLMSDPQVAHNAILVEIEHETGGRLRIAGPPARFGETPTSIRRLPPALGEHTAEVLTEIGVAEHELSELTAAGVVAGAPGATGR